MFSTKRKKLDYGEGSIIIYSPFGGGTRRVRVECRESDIKNGRPGFDGVLVSQTDGDATEDGDGVWGYDDQIIRVVKR